MLFVSIKPESWKEKSFSSQAFRPQEVLNTRMKSKSLKAQNNVPTSCLSVCLNPDPPYQNTLSCMDTKTWVQQSRITPAE